MVFDIIYLCVYAAVSILLCVSIKNIPVMPYNDEAGSAYWNKIKDKSEEIGESEELKKELDEELDAYMKTLSHYRARWELRMEQSKNVRHTAQWFYNTVIVALFPYERILALMPYSIAVIATIAFFCICVIISVKLPMNTEYFDFLKTDRQLVDELLADVGRADPSLKYKGEYPDYHCRIEWIINFQHKSAENHRKMIDSSYYSAYSAESHLSYPVLFTAIFAIARFSFAAAQYL